MGDTWTDDDDEMLAAESKTYASAMLRLNIALGRCAREIRKAWRHTHRTEGAHDVNRNRSNGTMINTDNDFMLGSNGQTISPFLPVIITSREQAYRTAAWLKTMASTLPREDEDAEPTFEEIESAIRST